MSRVRSLIGHSRWPQSHGSLRPPARRSHPCGTHGLGASAWKHGQHARGILYTAKSPNTLMRGAKAELPTHFLYKPKHTWVVAGLLGFVWDCPNLIFFWDFQKVNLKHFEGILEGSRRLSIFWSHIATVSCNLPSSRPQHDAGTCWLLEPLNHGPLAWTLDPTILDLKDPGPSKPKHRPSFKPWKAFSLQSIPLALSQDPPIWNPHINSIDRIINRKTKGAGAEIRGPYFEP